VNPDGARAMGQRAGERYRKQFSRRLHAARWAQVIADMLANP